MNSLYDKILKSISEQIYLIYYKKYNKDYVFYVLGTTGFLYKVIINENNVKCNCENFEYSKICKHICFIYFKVMKLFNYNYSNYEIKLVSNNALRKTNYFNNLILSENELIEFKYRFNRIHKNVKSSFFNSSYYYKFLNFVNSRTFTLNSIKNNESKQCIICLQDDCNLLKCPICTSSYHKDCLLKWFKNLDNKKCPTCSSYVWNHFYKYIIFDDEKKIEFNLI